MNHFQYNQQKFTIIKRCGRDYINYIQIVSGILCNHGYMSIIIHDNLMVILERIEDGNKLYTSLDLYCSHINEIKKEYNKHKSKNEDYFNHHLFMQLLNRLVDELILPND